MCTLKAMRILGIDPGLNVTGYGCVEDQASHARDQRSGNLGRVRLVEAGVFRLKRSESMAARLVQLHDDLSEVLTELSPDLVVVEKLFSHYKHVRTSILMGHARGVVLLAAERHGAAVDELAATEVKKAMCGNGHATKRQVQHAVMSQCGLDQPPEPHDVADAIAIALCASRRRMLEDALAV